MPEPTSDEILMAAYQAGNEAAFTELFERHGGSVYGFLARRLPERALADDLYQEVFLRLHRARHTYDSRRPFRAWLFGIVHNLLVDALRQQRRLPHGPSLDAAPGDTGEIAHALEVAALAAVGQRSLEEDAGLRETARALERRAERTAARRGDGAAARPRRGSFLRRHRSRHRPLRCGDEAARLPRAEARPRGDGRCRPRRTVVKQHPSCAEYRGWLVDSLGAPSNVHPPTALAEHGAACAACSDASAEIRAGWASFNDLPPLLPPVAVRERTRAAVLGLMAEEARGAARRRWYDVGRVPLAVVSGLLVTAATLSLLSGLVWGSKLPQGHLFFCAAIFTGLLVGAFSWIYSATTVAGVHLDVAARVGVLALAITIAATTACPEFHVLAWWDRSAVGRLLSRLLGPGGSSLVFGFGYGLLPGFLAALFGGRLLAERPLANGLVAAVVVFLLATPVIYLQAAPFTSGVVASWVAGTAAGTLCGVFGALRVRQRVATAPAAA